MTKRFFIALFSVACAAAFAWPKAKTDGFQYVTPQKFGQRVPVTVSGKSRDYYLLEPGKQIELTVRGPARLQVLTRAVLNSPQDSVNYTFLTARKSSRATVTFTHSSHFAEQAKIAVGADSLVGLLRKKVVDVPRGDQHYIFFLPRNAKTKLLFRFAVSTNEFTNGTPVTAMTPMEYTTMVNLVSREEVADYYRVGHGDSVAMKVIGPATLKILTRVEFDSNMTGRQKWRVQVLEGEKVKATYLLSGRKSESASYKEVSPLVPSRAETFFVEVPAGEHRYSFRLPDNHRTVLLRFLLPKAQLERE